MRVAVAGGTGVVGRHVVDGLRASGHDPLVLTRSSGYDLTATTAHPGRPELIAALAGCGAVIDVSSIATTSGAKSTAFFEAVTRTLLAAERSAEVPHHIALSIVGASAAPAAYYAGKKRQEDLVMASGGGWSILRATQFHEFAVQMAAQGRIGPIQVVPRMTAQPVAAAEVAGVLIEIALGEPRGLDRDLGGPRTENMADLVRRYLAATGHKRPVLEVPFPGAWGRALNDGTILADAAARRGEQTFAEWLAVL